MDFTKAFRDACILMHLAGEDKESIIGEMVDFMISAGKIKDRESVISAVMERERKMSTGMQFGVAIPHGKVARLDSLVTALALKPEGVDFGSFDGEPSRIFVMTLSPLNRTGPHIQYLSEISKLLNRPTIRKKLIEAQTEAEVRSIIGGT